MPMLIAFWSHYVKASVVGLLIWQHLPYRWRGWPANGNPKLFSKKVELDNLACHHVVSNVLVAAETLSVAMVWC